MPVIKGKEKACIFVPGELHKTLKVLAAKCGISLSELTTMIIREYLCKQKN